MMRLALVATLVLSLAANVSLIGWFIVLSPVERMVWKARATVLIYDERPTVILGDSILVSLPKAEGVINLAVSGATVPFIVESILPEALQLKPKRILIGLGINDLRAGRTPENVIADLDRLANKIAESSTTTETILLTILPLASNTDLAGATTNTEISATNVRLASLAAKRPYKTIDHTALFITAGSLDDDLTTDGLHLNEDGVCLLTRLLLLGLVAQGCSEI